MCILNFIIIFVIIIVIIIQSCSAAFSKIVLYGEDLTLFALMQLFFMRVIGIKL